MFSVDVPMYFKRYQEDLIIGKEYISVYKGIFETINLRIVYFKWEDWKGEVDWMSMYFSFAVWIS